MLTYIYDSAQTITNGQDKKTNQILKQQTPLQYLIDTFLLMYLNNQRTWWEKKVKDLHFYVPFTWNTGKSMLPL